MSATTDWGPCMCVCHKGVGMLHAFSCCEGQPTPEELQARRGATTVKHRTRGGKGVVARAMKRGR